MESDCWGIIAMVHAEGHARMGYTQRGRFLAYQEEPPMRARLADHRIQDFLQRQDIAILATLQKDGAPLATPMWFVVDNESFGMVSVAATQKVRNLRRDSRVCVVVESGTRGAEIRGVSMQGRVVFLDQADAYRPVVDRLLRKYDPYLAALWGGTTMPANRVVFQILPAKVHSWGLG
jgi:PPOX class probable F420-dependent enzyme